MKTYIIPKKEIKRKWYLIDASGQILGRLSTQVADLLRGKNKTCWSPHQDCGDYVIIINASKIQTTGKKLEDKKYYRHTGYSGGLKVKTLKEKMEKDPTQVIRVAVKGMLPHNKLSNRIITKLKIYPKDYHPHKGQIENYQLSER
jgi:large subunit ribosomal protein L13